MIKIPKKTIKKKINKIVSKQSKQVAKYIGDIEIYIPNFNKIVNKGNLVPGFSLKEAKARRDFTIVNEKEN